MVTGDKNAFYKMCMVLPNVIERVVTELNDTLVPNDIVLDELKEMVSKYKMETEDLSFAMAVFLLGFGTYLGFDK